ncbi:hypothetical protein T492DRAFT_987837, partial [Pavlovales sp. CCMP2436]
MSVARMGQVRLVIDEVRAVNDVASHLASRGRLSAPPRPTGGEQEACHLWAKDVHAPRRARPSRADGHRRQPEYEPCRKRDHGPRAVRQGSRFSRPMAKSFLKFILI